VFEANQPFLGISLLVGSTLLGNVLGYELSNDRTPAPAESFRVLPTVSVTHQGSSLGVVGQF
jgi:hypothetical protein